MVMTPSPSACTYRRQPAMPSRSRPGEARKCGGLNRVDWNAGNTCAPTVFRILGPRALGAGRGFAR